MEEELTPQEREELKELMGYAGPVDSSRQTVHSFLHNVATAKDTTKLGNLREEEIGLLSNPVRSFKHLALFSRKIMKSDELADFFDNSSEIGTSTSLSRDGFLTKLAVVTRKELADVTKPRKENKGWFSRKKDENENSGEQQ